MAVEPLSSPLKLFPSHLCLSPLTSLTHHLRHGRSQPRVPAQSLELRELLVAGVGDKEERARARELVSVLCELGGEYDAQAMDGKWQVVDTKGPLLWRQVLPIAHLAECLCIRRTRATQRLGGISGAPLARPRTHQCWGCSRDAARVCGYVGVWVQLTQSGPASLASVENNSFQDFSVKVRAVSNLPAACAHVSQPHRQRRHEILATHPKPPPPLHHRIRRW